MSDSTYEQGLKTRTAVMGSEHVTKAMSPDPVSDAFQRIVTEFAWGAVWSRPELSREIRSMLTIAMLAALNRPNELRLHVRAALRNGVTKDKISEVLLHAMVYCGAPAAHDSLRIAKEVFAEVDKQPRP